MGKAKNWTKSEEDFLRNRYKRMPLREISRILKKTPCAIQHKAIRLGLSEPSFRREWTDDEVEYLIKCYEKKSGKDIAKHLNRTVESVSRKAQSLNLNTYATDMISAGNVGKSFGLATSTVTGWIERKKLPAKKESHGRKKYIYRIDIDEFWKWAYENKNILPWTKYQKGSLIPEPEWINNVRRESETRKNHRQRINSMDIATLKYMRQRGRTINEIASALGRSRYSIVHMIRAQKI